MLMKQKTKTVLQKTIAMTMTFLLSAVLLLSVHMTTDAASKKDQKAVTKLTDNMFTAVKNYDIAKIGKCTKVVDKKTEIYRSWVYSSLSKVQKKINKENFSYSINKITIKGNKATIKVNVSYLDVSKEYEAAYGEALHWLYHNKKASSKKFANKVAGYYKDNYLKKLAEMEYEDDDYDEDYEDDDDYDDEDSNYDDEEDPDYDDDYDDYDDEDDEYVSPYTEKTVIVKATKIKGRWYITNSNKDFKVCIDGGASEMDKYIAKNIKKYRKKYYKS